MSLEIIRLLVDFGLFVLIWIIQLIIYPSFLYYSPENLIPWHRKYTRLIGYIVGPLMILQLGIAVYQTTLALSPYHLISLGIIGIVWISTFLQFVPLHNKISKAEFTDKTLTSLVKKNWLRTFLWTLLLLLSLAYYTFFGL